MLVRLARKAVTTFLTDSTIVSPPTGLVLRTGIFVTLTYLTRRKEEHLRGCIGFALPHKDIYESVIDAAIAAATADPRFPPVDLPELPNIIFEVSVLSAPKPLSGDLTQIRNSIRIGRDGLILRWKYGSGLLLPQVPVDLKWDVEDFLANICHKAGAPMASLNDPESTLFSFEATAFRELEPLGKVAKVHS